MSSICTHKNINGTPVFLHIILENSRFETFHYGIKYSIISLSKKFMTTLDSWSKSEECISLLWSTQIDNKKDIQCTKSFPLRLSSVNVTFTKEILNRKLHFLCSNYPAMTPQIVGIVHVYGPKIIVRIFEHFVTSRSY